MSGTLNTQTDTTKSMKNHSGKTKEKIKEDVINLQNDIIKREFQPEHVDNQGQRKTMRKYHHTMSHQTFAIKDN